MKISSRSREMKISKTAAYFISINIAVILNVISHYLENLANIGSIYYMSYVIWILLFFQGIIFDAKIHKRSLYIIAALLTVALIGTVHGDSVYGTGFSDFHYYIFFIVAFFVCFGFRYKIHCRSEQLISLANCLLILGLIAVGYAMFYQGMYFIAVLRGISVDFNSWKFVSIFRQRNIYGEFCFIAAFASLLLTELKQKKIYWVFTLLFGIQIFATNSRAALLAYAMLIFFYIYLKTRKKFLLILIVLTFALLLIYNFRGSTSLTNRLFHSAGEYDSGFVRLKMWQYSLSEIWDNSAILCGLGLGNVGVSLMPLFGVGSTHNAYLDLLFGGGIAYELVQVITLILVFRKVMRWRDKTLKCLYISFIISYAMYCFLEAGMVLFMANYFSVTITILLVLIPGLYSDDAGSIQKIYKS